MTAKQLIPTVQHGNIRATVEEVTPELASIYLQILEYGGQRKVRQAHVERLSNEMRRGTFRPGTMIETMAFGGREYLINGQHRLHAVIESGTTQVFTIQQTVVNSMEEIAFAYGRTDIGLKRTSGDMYSALDLAGRLHLPSRAITDLSGAIGFMIGGFTRTGFMAGMAGAVPPETIIDRMALYAPHMITYWDIAANCQRSIRAGAFRAATLSVALLTLRFTAPQATEKQLPSVADFWAGVIHDDGITATDPRKFAMRHIRDTTMSMNGRATSGRIVVGPAYSCRYLASCFKAYMEGRQVRLVKVLDEAAPFEVYGAPIDQEKWWSA